MTKATMPLARHHQTTVKRSIGSLLMRCSTTVKESTWSSDSKRPSKGDALAIRSCGCSGPAVRHARSIRPRPSGRRWLGTLAANEPLERDGGMCRCSIDLTIMTMPDTAE
jgi:hypothetical protein